MGKNKIWIALGAAAIVLAAAIGFWFYGNTFVSMEGNRFRRDAETVDLRGVALSKPGQLLKFRAPRQMDLRGTGISADDYEKVAEAYPECDIQWDVPFQGKLLGPETESVEVSSLTEADARMLGYLPNLQTVYAWDCNDAQQLQAFQRSHPATQVLYHVNVLGERWDSDDTEMTLRNVNMEELMEKLVLLPRVSKVTLTGELPNYSQIEELSAAYPNVELNWETEVNGQEFRKDSEKLDLTGMKLSTDDVQQLLPFFPAAKTVVIRDCGLSNDEGMALMQANPDRQFVWDIEICGMKFSTDTHEIDISGCYVDRPTVVEELLPFFPNVTKVVMSECGVDSETMEAMNLRHDDVQFVWSIYLNNLLMRTDATWFMPVKYHSFVTDEHLKEFHYFHNMEAIDFGHMGVTNCEWVREMPNLRFLLLADTGISDISPVEGLEKLEYLELFQTYIRDVTPITKCPNLKDLNLCYTYADPTPLIGMTWLDKLWWMGNTEAPGILTQDLFPNTELDFSPDGSSTGDGWREGKRYFEMRDIFGMWYMIG